MDMNTRRLLQLTLLVCCFSGVAQPAAYAQKNVSKIVQSMGGQSVRSAFPHAAESQIRHFPFTKRLAPLAPRAQQSLRQHHFSYAPAAGVTAPAVKTDAVTRSVNRSQSAQRSRKNKKWMAANPRDKAEQLLNQTGGPVPALQALWRLRKFYQNRPLFSFLATAYYKQHFVSLTPHLREFFKNVERLDDYKLQYRIFRRMEFIIKNQEMFRTHFAPHIPVSGMRLRYTKNIARLTPENYAPHSLVLSFEQRLDPQHPKAAIRHVTARSSFQVGKKAFYHVYRYNGPLEFLPNLYVFLLNGDHSKSHITIVVDKEARSMAVYNEDRTLWLRITPHEYASPDNLHLHLNEIRTAQLYGKEGRPVKETVNFNLFIPLARPSHLPAQNQQDYLYEMMIVKPLRYFQGNAHVTIVEHSIF